jgi:hypothetical protein
MMIARSFPADQSSRSTISWITFEMSGVRWAGPASPLLVQAAGDQLAVSLVRVRAEMSLLADRKVGASPTSSPAMTRSVCMELVSSAWNWIQAVSMVANWGMGAPVKRRPTSWFPDLSRVISRSPLLVETPPAALCSASSDLADTRISTGTSPPAPVTVKPTVSLPVSSPSDAVTRRT